MKAGQSTHQYLFYFGLGAILCLALISIPAAVEAYEAAYEPGQILVEFDPGIIPTSEQETGIPDVDALIRNYGILFINRAFRYDYHLSDLYERWWVFHFPTDTPVEIITKQLLECTSISFAQLNHRAILEDIYPNDYCFTGMDDSQWNLHNYGQHSGKPDADIDAPEGWQYFSGAQFNGIPGSSDITVAVLDSGIIDADPGDPIPPEFDNRIVILDPLNPPDITDENDSSIEDTLSNRHGSKCAGYVGANWDNAIQIAGIDARCKIMPIQVYQGNNSGNELMLANGINYAAGLTPLDRPQILSISLAYGGAGQLCPTTPDSSRKGILLGAVRAAKGAGCTIVVAAGNHGPAMVNNYWPACFPEVITVGSTDHEDKRSIWNAYEGLESSSTGAELDVMAPAGKGYSAIPQVWIPSINVADMNNPQCLETFTGTSSAAPQVAGVASLMLALNPYLQPIHTLLPDDIACLLRAGADDQIGPLSGNPEDIDSPGRDNNYGWGRISMNQTFACIANPSPGAPQLLEPGNGTAGQGDQSFDVDLKWAEASCAEKYEVFIGLVEHLPSKALTNSRVINTANISDLEMEP